MLVQAFKASLRVEANQAWAIQVWFGLWICTVKVEAQARLLTCCVVIIVVGVVGVVGMVVAVVVVCVVFIVVVVVVVSVVVAVFSVLLAKAVFSKLSHSHL